MDTALPDWAIYVIGAGIGLVIGSFLNVVIVRVPAGASVASGRSECPTCHAEIRWYDNVPVLSVIVLRGRCRNCDTQIAWAYPLVELAGAGAVVLSLALFELTWNTLIAAVLLLGLIPLAVIDYREHRLPNPIVAALAIVGIALVVAGGFVTGEWRRVIEAAAAGAAALVFFALLAWGSELLTGRSGMGWGDVKLAGVLGLYLGWIAPRYIVICLLAAFLLGALVGIGLIIAGRGSRKTPLPFGVYLALGAVVALVIAQPVGDWYLRVGVG